MIECSSTVLLTHAVERDASEVISEAWFYVATWDRRCWHQKSWHFLSHFHQKMGIMATAAPKGKSFPFWRITKFATVYGSSVIQLPSALIEAVRSPFGGIDILW